MLHFLSTGAAYAQPHDPAEEFRRGVQVVREVIDTVSDLPGAVTHLALDALTNYATRPPDTNSLAYTTGETLLKASEEAERNGNHGAASSLLDAALENFSVAPRAPKDKPDVVPADPHAAAGPASSTPAEAPYAHPSYEPSERNWEPPSRDLPERDWGPSAPSFPETPSYEPWIPGPADWSRRELERGGGWPHSRL